MRPLSVAEAQARVIALGTPLEGETVPLVEAAGRWAARDVLALRTQPALDLSAMDGYAIRFAELPGPWTVAGESAAGHALGRALAPHEAARIFTGAPLPAGADTVLVQEDAARDDERLRLAGDRPRAEGQHVRAAGSDFTAGATLIEAGILLSPARIALAAMGGHGALPVRRRARVALISTGDELIPAGAAVDGARLPATNAPMLTAMLASSPVDVVDLGIVPDDLDRLAAVFEEADADVIVTTGGASVGDHDLVRPALRKAGAEIDFWRVAMKPGKPLMAGKLGPRVVLGLPGNPVSAYVTATVFLKPLLAALMGAADSVARPIEALLDAPLPATGARAEYLRGRWSGGGVASLTGQDSAALCALADAQLLIVRPANASAAQRGDRAEILPLA